MACTLLKCTVITLTLFHWPAYFIGIKIRNEKRATTFTQGALGKVTYNKRVKKSSATTWSEHEVSCRVCVSLTGFYFTLSGGPPLSPRQSGNKEDAAQ